METKQKELKDAVDLVIESYGGKNINLDYSPESVKHLDKMFDDLMKNGKPRNPKGTFAQYQGFIMLGISGYISEVVLRNTINSNLNINETDPDWYMNFSVTSEHGWTMQPGQRVIKRAYQGKEFELFAYVLSAIKHFSETQNNQSGDPESPKYINEVYIRENSEETDKKPWWKIW